jgi:hypothetical protein
MTAGELYESIISKFGDAPPVETMYSAIGIVSDYLASRLFMLGSDLLREEVSLAYEAGVNTADLPFGLIGTIELPFAVNSIGDRYAPELTPLPRGMRSILRGAPNGTPRHFEITGDSLVLFPAPAQPCTVIFEASIPPEKPTMPSDDIPFNGLFDYIFREVVLLVMQQGGGAVMQADAYLTKTLDAVDRNRATRTVAYRYFA